MLKICQRSYNPYHDKREKNESTHTEFIVDIFLFVKGDNNE